MKTVKIDLPRETKQAEIHLFADEHIGDSCSDVQRVIKRVEEVKKKPNAYAILNGDLIDNATKMSIGDIYAQRYNPMEQLKVANEIFEPIKDRILCITQGNHENRTYRNEGINLSYLIANQLGVEERYTQASALLFVRLGEGGTDLHNRPFLYTIFVNHGTGGGKLEGAKAIALARMASIVDADIYVHSHTHLPMIMKQGFFRTDLTHNTVQNINKLFVNTGSNLDYGGYGEVSEFKPNSKDTPRIYLSGSKKAFWAEL